MESFMSMMKVRVDHDLREVITYHDISFPVSRYLDEYKMFANNTVNCHWHNALEFCIMISGEVDYYINDVHMKLTKGDCVFVNMNTMHMSAQCPDSEDAVMFGVVFPSSLFSSNIDSTIYTKYIQPIINGPIQGFRVENSYHGEKIRQTLHEVSTLKQDCSGYEIHCLSLLARLWYETLSYINEYKTGSLKQRFDRTYEQRAKRILSYIHGNYSENITVQDIARSTGISRSECFRCFKKVTNKKPAEYINEYRLTQAARLLLETDERVTEICTSCGFGSSSYFGKLFKDSFGMSPLMFRREGGNRSDR